MIGDNIKTIRDQKKISQYRLSKRTGISQSYISELENGKYKNPTIDIIHKIAKALNVSVTQLLDKTSEKVG